MENFISIILPTYKRVSKIKKALNSILSQNYNNWEAIIVDNKSKDGTKEIVESYKNKNFSFYEIENEGVIAKSRNFAISKSKGKYLAFLDSDDWWSPDKLKKTNYYINQGYNFLYHDMYISKKRNFIKRKTSYCRKLKKPIYNDLIYNGPAFPTSSVTLNKKIFDKTGKFNEEINLITWEDYDAWINFSKVNEDFFKIPGVLGHIKIDEENLLNLDKQIDNIYKFNTKYIKEDKMPNWCIFSLLRLSTMKKDFIKAKKYIEDLDFFDLKFFYKIKFLILKILVFFKT